MNTEKFIPVSDANNGTGGARIEMTGEEALKMVLDMTPKYSDQKLEIAIKKAENTGETEPRDVATDRFRSLAIQIKNRIKILEKSEGTKNLLIHQY